MNKPITTTEIVRERDVPNALGMISESVQHLQSSLDSLEARLGSILRNQLPVGKELANKPEKIMVEHAGVIKDYAEKINQSAYLVDDILNRLEL